MTLVPLRALLLAAGLSAMSTALAQEDAARALDLTVPREPIRFESVGASADHRNDPPGTWYGDHSGRTLPPEDAATSTDGDWRVHGAVEAGVGWSKHGGNSNWQGANVNLDKTYTDDEGDRGHVNIDINVGRGEGPVFGPGYFGPGYYDPGYLDAPMMPRGREPFRR
jgi:hypothetical protein